jgi:hypothetical protein
MRRWRLRRRQADFRVSPLTPAQVQALRHRDAQVGLWATRFFIAGATMAALVVAGVAIGYSTDKYMSLAVLGIGNAVIYVCALVATFRGYSKPAGLLVLMMSVLTIVAICSVISTASSSESVMFGLALVPFILVRGDEGFVRLALASGREPRDLQPGSRRAAHARDAHRAAGEAASEPSDPRGGGPLR